MTSHQPTGFRNKQALLLNKQISEMKTKIFAQQAGSRNANMISAQKVGFRKAKLISAQPVDFRN